MRTSVSSSAPTQDDIGMCVAEWIDVRAPPARVRRTGEVSLRVAHSDMVIVHSRDYVDRYFLRQSKALEYESMNEFAGEAPPVSRTPMKGDNPLSEVSDVEAAAI